jgi:hypothetical protein
MPPVDAHVEVLQQPDLPPAAAVAVVSRQSDEIEVVNDRQRPSKIGDEDERGFQRGNKDRLEPFVVGGNLRTELLDPSPDLLTREVDVPDSLLGA